MTPAESLVWVQRKYLDLMHERNATLALLREARPYVHVAADMDYFEPSGESARRAQPILDRIDAAIGGAK
jgi:hypothetical protein